MKSEMKSITETLKFFITFMMDQTNITKSSPTQKDTSTPLEPTKLGPDKKRASQLEGENSTKIGGIWTLKHEISPPKFYELLIKIELKADTALDLNIF